MFDDQPIAGASLHKKGAPPEDIFEGLDDAPDVTAPSTPPASAPASAPAPASASIAPPVSMDAPTPVVSAPKKEHRLAEDLPSPPPTNPPMMEKPLPAGLSDSDLSSAPPVIPSPRSFEEPAQRKSKGKIIMIVVLIVLVVVVALLLTGLIMRSRRTVVTPSLNDVRTPIETIVNETVTQQEVILEGDLLLGGDTTPVPPPEPVDSDRDGLSDEEELALGTSPRSADTDADGLSDRDEVEVWKSDPLNPDTDGDGYLDGDEVTNGYNPNGSGKLFEVPSTP